MKTARPSSNPSSRTASRPTGALRAAQRVAEQTTQEVRIIGGRWKRTPLPVPVSAGLRPTPSRVRETLFNWLGQDLSGWRVLDAFAGSGALGLEAASRGAAPVTLIERDAGLARGLRQVLARLKALGIEVVQGDALNWMRHAPAGAFDLVFLDPPFDEELFEPALAAALRCVPDGGWVYLEANEAIAPLAGTRLYRQGQAGAVHFHLFQRVDDAATAGG